ncbi:hypothetical protein D3C87_1197880 [compost metagenome]
MARIGWGEGRGLGGGLEIERALADVDRRPVDDRHAFVGQLQAHAPYRSPRLRFDHRAQRCHGHRPHEFEGEANHRPTRLMCHGAVRHRGQQAAGRAAVLGAGMPGAA